MTLRNLFPCITAAVLMFCPLVHGAQSYIVKPNDTLDGIGRRHGLTAKDLAVYNHLTNPDRLSIGQELLIPEKAPAYITYAIRSGDTLSQVARRFGTTTSALTQLNGIKRPDRLKIGQLIRVPRSGGVSSGSARTQLPSTVRRTIDGYRVRPGRWKYIVVHHTATASGSVAGIDRAHRKKGMENGMAYHFLIGNGKGMRNGEIGIGSRWYRQLHGGHLKSESQNRISIGICLVGNFENTRPTRQQMTSLRALVNHLTRKCGIPKSRVMTHQEINVSPTACPGKNFSLQSATRDL